MVYWCWSRARDECTPPSLPSYWQINTFGLFSYTRLIQVPGCTVTRSAHQHRPRLSVAKCRGSGGKKEKKYRNNQFQALPAIKQRPTMGKEEFNIKFWRNYGKLRRSGDFWTGGLLPPIATKADPRHRNRPLQRWRACYTKSNTKGDRESKKNKYAKYLQKTI